MRGARLDDGGAADQGPKRGLRPPTRRSPRLRPAAGPAPAIQENLQSLMAGKTVVAIAHRLSTIAAMDRLIVMDRGRIVETGTHAELVKRADGLYARLWARQSGGFLALGEAAE